MSSNRFFPRKAFINDITNAQQSVVTFTENHDFLISEIVSFRVTKDFGMFEINNKSGKILDKTDNSITVNIDSTTWTTFDYSSLDMPGTTPPVCVPSASGVVKSEIPQTNLDDSFDNRRTD